MDLNILIVGAGMYVCGKSTTGFGTILPALIKVSKRAKINIYMAATSKISVENFQKKLLLNHIMV